MSTVIEGLKRASEGRNVGGRGRPPRRRRVSRRALALVVLVAPSIALLALLNAQPVAFAIYQSFHSGTLIGPGPFVGFDNFTTVLTSQLFWSAARFTVIFTVVGVFGSWIIGFALALLLRTRIPGSPTFKVLLLLPWIVPVVVSTASWQWLLGTPTSIVPAMLKNLGFGEVLFLADPTLAAVTVCLFKMWVSVPFMMLMSASALTAVNESVYEAARIDGASRRQILFQITAPLIARPTYISWILMTIFCVNDFPSIYLLTGGGPVNSTTTLIVMAYRSAFQDFQTGVGVAIALMLTTALVLVSLFLFRQIRKSALQ